MAVQYAPLFSLETQFQAKDGSNNTAGWLKVYLAATDDPAETYSDYLGTRNPEKIVLDDNGRAVVICDKAKAYRLEVYDADGMLLWTEEPVYCSGTGGGGISVTEVISTDGSIAVESSIAGSMRTYDISIAPDNAKELLEWAKCSNTVDEDGYVYPLYGEGTMQTQVGKGLEVFKDRYYHLTNKITVIPSANGINYETITVQVMHDDNNGTVISLASHDFDIDNSVSDKVELEFSEDIIPEDNGFIFWRVTGRAPFNYVGLDMQIHRIYSGINAVPGFIASKPWVEQNISSKIDYSALEYNSDNEITAINGSSLAGGGSVDPTQFIPWSASGTFQQSGDYAFNSSLSSKLDASASSMFAPSGNYQSALTFGYDGSKISSIDGSGIGGQYSGIYPVVVDNTAETIAVDNLGMEVDDTMTAYASGGNMVIGVRSGLYASELYVDSAVSSKLDSTAYNSAQFILTSQSGSFQPSGYYQPSGEYLSATESSNYQLTANMSAYIPVTALGTGEI